MNIVVISVTSLAFDFFLACGLIQCMANIMVLALGYHGLLGVTTAD